MNIFYLHKDPVVCAPLHCDKHVVKMIIEYAQMLSTAHRMLDGKEYIDASSGRRIRRWRHPNSNMDGVLYKASHINHPSAIWVRASVNNYQWTLRLWQQLCFEYTYSAIFDSFATFFRLWAAIRFRTIMKLLQKQVVKPKLAVFVPPSPCLK